MGDKKLNLLIIGDVHGDINTLSKIILSIQEEEFDAVLLSGDLGLSLLNGSSIKNDLCQRIYETSINSVFNILSNKNCPIFFIPGNWDKQIIRSKLKNCYNVDIIGSGKINSIKDLKIAGIGGSSFIDGQFSYEWKDDYCYNQFEFKLEINDNDKYIFLIHDPPFNTNLDINILGRHSGSKITKSIIKKFKPYLCICGHIHESAGLLLVNNKNSLLINAGSISNKITAPFEFSNNSMITNLFAQDQYFIVTLFEDDEIYIRHYFRINNIIYQEAFIKNNKGLFQK